MVTKWQRYHSLSVGQKSDSRVYLIAVTRKYSYLEADDS